MAAPVGGLETTLSMSISEKPRGLVSLPSLPKIPSQVMNTSTSKVIPH